MSEDVFPPMTDVLPHRGRMMLLSRILGHSETQTTCAVEIRPDSPFVGPAGTVATWVGIEYMAQCVAAHAGLRARARGEPPKIGFLIGARRVELRTRDFRIGQTLTAQASHTWGDRESGSFACRILEPESGAVLVEATLTVYQPTSVDRFRQPPP